LFARLRFAKRRREWILGRWTAKQLLRRSQQTYGALPLHAISVGNDPDGAPYLSVEGQGRLELSLSISHCQDRAFCALSPTLPPTVGADLEHIERRDPAFVHDFFTTAENKRIWTCPTARRDALITVVWSAKEAALKALRHGLRVDTRSVEVVHVAGLEGIQAAVQTLPDQPWHKLEIRCTLRHTVPLHAWWQPWEDFVLTLAACG
jgi:4'-phosphopantetheinyl transferase